MTIFSAFDTIHAWCEEDKPLKRSLSYFCGNEYVKYVIDGKVYMKLSVGAERKINLRQKNFGPTFFVFKLSEISVGVPFVYRKNLERIRRMRNVTIYDFRHVHLEPVKNVMLFPVKTFDWLFNRKYVFYQTQVNTDNCFWRCFQHNKDRKRMHSKKIIVYR